MIVKYRVVVFLIFVSVTLFAQNPVLDQYIKEGLSSNQSLKQKQMDYSKSLYAIKEARGYFFPDINLNARYTVADGGRTIEFPVGDLLNDVYSTLNILTQSQNFPSIENEEFDFYRPKEHETKVSVKQPVFSSDILNRVEITKAYSEIARVSIEKYKRSLILEIKHAYYNYLKSFSLLNLADSTLRLVNENLRVSRSLYENDLVTIDVVYRSEAEISKVEVEKAKAKSLYYRSMSFFNFLLNRPLNTEIERFFEKPEVLMYSLDVLQEEAANSREEIDMLRANLILNERKLAMQKGNFTPDIFGTVDYGFQGEEYKFSENDDFVLASLVLRWNIFHGLSSKNKTKQIRIESERIDLQLSEAQQKIKLEVLNKYYELAAAYQAVEAEKKNLEASRHVFRIIKRKYEENQATLLEYIDARTVFTNARSSLIIARTDYFLQKASFEYAAAMEDFSVYLKSEE